MSTTEVEPPSYHEANAEPRAIPLIIQLHQHSPDQLLDGHLMTAGKLLSEQGDAILLPTTTTYEEALALLKGRVLARAALMKSSTQHRFFCRLTVIIDGQQILLEEGSWLAARHFLRYQDDAELHFLFSIVPATYSGAGFLNTMRRKLGAAEMEKICLIELGL